MAHLHGFLVVLAVFQGIVDDRFLRPGMEREGLLELVECLASRLGVVFLLAEPVGKREGFVMFMAQQGGDLGHGASFPGWFKLGWSKSLLPWQRHMPNSLLRQLFPPAPVTNAARKHARPATAPAPDYKSVIQPGIRQQTDKNPVT